MARGKPKGAKVVCGDFKGKKICLNTKQVKQAERAYTVRLKKKLQPFDKTK